MGHEPAGAFCLSLRIRLFRACGTPELIADMATSETGRTLFADLQHFVRHERYGVDLARVLLSALNLSLLLLSAEKGA